MKILLLHQYFKFPSEPGGTRTYDLAKRFLNKGYEISVVTTTSKLKYNIKNKVWTKEVIDGIAVYYIFLPYDNSFSNFKRVMQFFKFVWFATIKSLSIKTDLIIATSTPLTIGLPALVNKIVRQKPYIFEVRDVWPEAVIAIGAVKNPFIKKILYYLEYIIYKKASAIVTLSTDMKSSIVSRFPHFSKKLQVIENISEIQRFQDYKSNSSVLKEKIGFCPRFTVLYAGTFGRVNGLNYVLELASRLINIDSSICFLLIGDGVEKEIIFETTREKCLLNKNVFFLDSVSKQELPHLYQECSMGSSFVINIKELWANSANKFFDTLAAGKPILINHEGWQKEMIELRNVGYVLPPKLNFEAIKSFAEYTKNPILIQKQGENALNLAKEKYSLEVAGDKYLKTFAELKMHSKVSTFSS